MVTADATEITSTRRLMSMRSRSSVMANLSFRGAAIANSPVVTASFPKKEVALTMPILDEFIAAETSGYAVDSSCLCLRGFDALRNGVLREDRCQTPVAPRFRYLNLEATGA